MPGKLIVFEGIQGSGKTTCRRMLLSWLKQHGVEAVDARVEAEKSEIGKELRRNVAEIAANASPLARALLVAADRAQAVEDVIVPALQDDKLVVVDRYHLTNVVYQGLIGGVGQDVPFILEALATRGASADLTLLLTCPAEVAFRRISGDKDFWEQQGYGLLEAARQAYLVAAKTDNRLVFIDADQNIEDVFGDVLSALGQANLLP